MEKASRQAIPFGDAVQREILQAAEIDIYFDEIQNKYLFKAEGRAISKKQAVLKLQGELIARKFNHYLLRDYAEVIIKNNAAVINPIADMLKKQKEESAEELSHLIAAAINQGSKAELIYKAMVQQIALNCFQSSENPICQEFILVFAGRQGAGKTRAVKALCPFGVYTKLENPALNPTEKDHLLFISTAAAFELSEIDETIKLQSSNKLKTFITAFSDAFRAPYAEEVEERPRRCVFYGTTNLKRFLVDDTGNRRFITLDFEPSDRFAVDCICKNRILGAYKSIYNKLKQIKEEGGNIREQYCLNSELLHMQEKDNLSRLQLPAGSEELLDLIEGQKVSFFGTISELKARFSVLSGFDVRILGKALRILAQNNGNIVFQRSKDGRKIYLNKER